jgi:hypothetical protein
VGLQAQSRDEAVHSAWTRALKSARSGWGKGHACTTRSAGVLVRGSRLTLPPAHSKKGGSRRTAGAVASVIGKRGYRSDLLKGECWDREMMSRDICDGIGVVARSTRVAAQAAVVPAWQQLSLARLAVRPAARR